MGNSGSTKSSGHPHTPPRVAHGIIPARFASSRLPGKPLLSLHGKPMFWHVWQRASRCPQLTSVTLATDDTRIADAAKELGVPCVMTHDRHPSGTDRVFEAATILGLPPQAIVVNIQGDEPALDPHMLTTLLHTFADPTVCAATLAHPMPQGQGTGPDKVKVVVAANGNALYFSRAGIPFAREPHECPAPCLGHIGLYAFTMETLRQFVNLPPSPLERTEKLEQLRLLENGIALRVAITPQPSRGVDTEEDIAPVLDLMQQRKN